MTLWDILVDAVGRATPEERARMVDGLWRLNREAQRDYEEEATAHGVTVAELLR